MAAALPVCQQSHVQFLRHAQMHGAHRQIGCVNFDELCAALSFVSVDIRQDARPAVAQMSPCDHARSLLCVA
jgi:hypothetical protein